MFLSSAFVLDEAVAFDPLDPTGNITIKWDVISWTPDGYVVSIYLVLFAIQVSKQTKNRLKHQ